MTEPLPEIALTEEEIDQILRSCDGRALLVGGQALAFWAQHYQLRLPGVLSANVTSDADFVGAAQVARDLWRSLKPMGWRYWQPSADDATSQTAKLTKRIEGQGIKQIDFLGSIVGLKTACHRAQSRRWHAHPRVASSGCARKPPKKSGRATLQTRSPGDRAGALGDRCRKVLPRATSARGASAAAFQCHRPCGSHGAGEESGECVLRIRT